MVTMASPRRPTLGTPIRQGLLIRRVSHVPSLHMYQAAPPPPPSRLLSLVLIVLRVATQQHAVQDMAHDSFSAAPGDALLRRRSRPRCTLPERVQSWAGLGWVRVWVWPWPAPSRNELVAWLPVVTDTLGGFALTQICTGSPFPSCRLPSPPSTVIVFPFSPSLPVAHCQSSLPRFWLHTTNQSQCFHCPWTSLIFPSSNPRLR